MKIFTSRFLWLGSVLILSLPWMLFGMPMSESNLINGLVVGLFGYFLSFKFKPAEPSRSIALLLLAVGTSITLLMFFMYGAGAFIAQPHRKLSALGGFLCGWALAEFVHCHLAVRNKT